MQNDSQLKMFQAVQAVCAAKPEVWMRSEKFRQSYASFCLCVEHIVRLELQSLPGEAQPTEFAVADHVLTAELDEMIEQFEKVDEQFVDDYTAARSLELVE